MNATLAGSWCVSVALVLLVAAGGASPAFGLDFEDAEFAADSGIITHPFLSESRPGLVLRFIGEGILDGQWEDYTAHGYETYEGIHSLRWDRAFGLGPGLEDTFHNFFAQDTAGNVWSLATLVYVDDEPQLIIDEPQLVLPTNVAQVGLQWTQLPGVVFEVIAINETLPQNQHGQGPFPGSIIVRQVDMDGILRYFTPGLGQVLTTYDFTSVTGAMVLAQVELPPSDAPWGDLNGNGLAGTVDASLVLQWDAFLIDKFPCCAETWPDFPAQGDVNADGVLGTVDAAMILQFDAFLIDCFPADPGCDSHG